MLRHAPAPLPSSYFQGPLARWRLSASCRSADLMAPAAHLAAATPQISFHPPFALPEGPWAPHDVHRYASRRPTDVQHRPGALPDASPESTVQPSASSTGCCTQGDLNHLMKTAVQPQPGWQPPMTWMQDTGRSGHALYSREFVACQHVAIHDIGRKNDAVGAPGRGAVELLHCRYITTPMLRAFDQR